MQRLVDNGNSILVIEHNLDVIRCADWIIDLGTDGAIRAARSWQWAPLKRLQSIPPVIRVGIRSKYYQSNQTISPGDGVSMIRAHKANGNTQRNCNIIILESRQITSNLHEQHSPCHSIAHPGNFKWMLLTQARISRRLQRKIKPSKILRNNRRKLPCILL